MLGNLDEFTQTCFGQGPCRRGNLLSILNGLTLSGGVEPACRIGACAYARPCAHAQKRGKEAYVGASVKRDICVRGRESLFVCACLCVCEIEGERACTHLGVCERVCNCTHDTCVGLESSYCIRLPCDDWRADSLEVFVWGHAHEVICKCNSCITKLSGFLTPSTDLLSASIDFVYCLTRRKPPGLRLSVLFA